MLNRYPLWKYLMLIVVILVGLLYALPNIYGEDPAVQITGARGVAASETTLDQVRTVLERQHREQVDCAGKWRHPGSL